MFIRSFVQPDLPRLVELTIETFGPFYEQSFRRIVGEAVFANQHGNWRDDYRTQVPQLHDPSQHRQVAVAQVDEIIVGYVAWSVDPARKNATIVMLATSADHRRHGLGTALCEHAFAHMRSLGAEVVEIGTGGDPFHAPARALYESLGCTLFPVAHYFRQL
ncbi:GNAT family N-acetyltransferase [Allorhizocola rhizosphaerae]|uniref:GNAT family N-acetyltransferase n=1 Tax=Allorhizocola rhizosphaerae TaxID=1872709 RepID=UPI000E3BBA27|nr:GNAT family N-acetyltransferase [Allorhizocola rhizosphaerae]